MQMTMKKAMEKHFRRSTLLNSINNAQLDRRILSSHYISPKVFS